MTAKSLLLACAGTLALSTAALGADLAPRPYTKAPPPIVAPAPSWRNAYAGLRQVAAWLAGKRQRQVSQWRGWTLRDRPR